MCPLHRSLHVGMLIDALRVTFTPRYSPGVPETQGVVRTVYVTYIFVRFSELRRMAGRITPRRNPYAVLHESDDGQSVSSQGGARLRGDSSRVGGPSQYPGGTPVAKSNLEPVVISPRTRHNLQRQLAQDRVLAPLALKGGPFGAPISRGGESPSASASQLHPGSESGRSTPVAAAAQPRLSAPSTAPLPGAALPRATASAGPGSNELPEVPHAELASPSALTVPPEDIGAIAVPIVRRNSTTDIGGQGKRSRNPGTYVTPYCRDDFRYWKGANKWHQGPCDAALSSPLYFCGACAVPCFYAYKQRVTLLEGQMERYECCAGICGRAHTDTCTRLTRGNEEICLGVETVLCIGCAIRGNRWMATQHYHTQYDCIDTSILRCAKLCCCMSYLAQDEAIEHACVVLYLPCCGFALGQVNQQMRVFGYPVGRTMQ